MVYLAKLDPDQDWGSTGSGRRRSQRQKRDRRKERKKWASKIDHVLSRGGGGGNLQFLLILVLEKTIIQEVIGTMTCMTLYELITEMES